jgi:putative PIN family toxin of toxin-antitoxin system
MKAVIDTVVFVRAAINPDSRWARVLSESGRLYRICASPAIIREILEVLTRSKLRERFPQIDAALITIVLPIVLSAEIVEPTESIAVCRDPKDDKFLECAVVAAADYIVSEDRDVLDIGEFRGIKTVTADRFLAILDQIA